MIKNDNEHCFCPACGETLPGHTPDCSAASPQEAAAESMVALDLNDPVLRAYALTIAECLLEHRAVSEALVVAFQVLRDLCLVVLHSYSNSPEINIQSLDIVVAKLRQEIDVHKRCAFVQGTGTDGPPAIRH